MFTGLLLKGRNLEHSNSTCKEGEKRLKQSLADYQKSEPLIVFINSKIISKCFFSIWVNNVASCSGHARSSLSHGVMLASASVGFLRSLVLQIKLFGFGHDSFTPESFTFHPQLHSPCHSLATLDK